VGNLDKYIFFNCNTGYSIKGNTLAACINGSWNSSTPTRLKLEYVSNDHVMQE